MTRLSKVLAELLNEKEMSQTSLAALSGVDQYRISRLINSQVTANADDISGLLAVFTDPAERYLVAHAHIADNLPPELFAQLDVSIREKPGLHENPPVMNHTHLTPRMRRAVDFLLSHLTENPAVADVLLDLALALGWEEKPPAPGKIHKYPKK